MYLYFFTGVSQIKYTYTFYKCVSFFFRLNLTMNITIWRNGSLDLPKSVCSEPCKAGHAMSYSEADSKCCWICMKCREWEYLHNEFTCKACPAGSLPDEDKTRCLPLPVQYMEIWSAWAIVPMVFATLGIMGVLAVLSVFIKYNSTPIIMASGRELCYMLMIGFFMCYGMTFVLVSKPMVVTCALTRFGLGLSLCVCYAALLTKTNRISRIFNRGIKAMMTRPAYTSPRSQVVITLCLVSVQLIGVTAWLIMEHPRTELVFPSREIVVLKCGTTNMSIVLSLSYNMILILMCTVYAFKTRKIPENFNEAKYIAFTMYSTCIVWLAFVPIYFGTKNDFRVSMF